MTGIEIKAVIFDMDGVLVDTEPHHTVIEQNMFRKLGLDVSEAEHKTYLGKSPAQMWEEVIRNHKLEYMPESLSRMNSDDIEKHFSDPSRIEVIPGVRKVLDELRLRNIPIALASSSDHRTIKILMKGAGLEEYFRFFVSSESVGRSKPDPAVYLHTAKLLEVKVEQCIVVEDSPNGIRAAKAAGMFCVAYKGQGSGATDQSLADAIIDDMSDLIGFLY